MFDVNILYGNWPFDYLRKDTPKAYIACLKSLNINGGLIASLESVFQRDLDKCNEIHFQRFRNLDSRFIPVMTVNPVYRNWREQLDHYSAKVIKLHPNYHGYELNGAAANPLFEYCDGKNIIPLVAMRMEDERSHVPSCRVPGVPAEAVIEQAKRHPSLKIICLSTYFREAVALVKETENVCVEHSFIERFQTLKTLLETCPPERVLFGTHTPLFYPEANIAKITHSGLPTEILKKITGNKF